MRILLTADPELPVPPVTYGGIERIVADLARGLRQRGHVVGLAARSGSTAEVDRLYPWPGTSSRGLWPGMRNGWALRRAVADFRPDVVHSFSRLAYLLPLLPSRLPKVMSYQREPSLRTTTRALRLARGTLTFTGCSEHICRTGRRAGGHWQAIPNFVDPDRYTFRSAVPADAPLVFLSRVEPIKGAHLAIDAARRAGHKLIIAGNHSEDGVNGRYWREQIAPQIGRDGIDYAGPVNDRQKDDLLGRAAALLVPVQWEEPFGIVFAEALACGTPVISCPRGALPEIVRDGREGFLAETVDGLVDAIGRLGEIDRGACRERAETAFSASVIVGQYEQLYRSVRGTPSAKAAAATRPEITDARVPSAEKEPVLSPLPSGERGRG
jgi:glycosyltransferase involved in cell wall biosynthesis